VPQPVAQLVHPLDGHAQGLGDARDLVALEVVEVVAQQPALEVGVGLVVADLEQQALLEVARADAGGVEPLHDGERRLHGLGRHRLVHPGEDLLERGAQEAAVGEVVDDGLGRRADVVGQVEDVELLHEVVREALLGGGGVLHRLPLAVRRLLARRPRELAAAAVGLDQALEPLEHALGVLVGALLVDADATLLRGESLARGLLDLEHLVLLQLVLDQLLQVHRGELEDLDGLDDLRREPQLLREALLEGDVEPHGRSPKHTPCRDVSTVASPRDDPPPRASLG